MPPRRPTELTQGRDLPKRLTHIQDGVSNWGRRWAGSRPNRTGAQTSPTGGEQITFSVANESPPATADRPRSSSRSNDEAYGTGPVRTRDLDRVSRNPSSRRSSATASSLAPPTPPSHSQYGVLHGSPDAGMATLSTATSSPDTSSSALTPSPTSPTGVMFGTYSERPSSSGYYGSMWPGDVSTQGCVPPSVSMSPPPPSTDSYGYGQGPFTYAPPPESHPVAAYVTPNAPPSSWHMSAPGSAPAPSHATTYGTSPRVAHGGATYDASMTPAGGAQWAQYPAAPQAYPSGMPQAGYSAAPDRNRAQTRSRTAAGTGTQHMPAHAASMPVPAQGADPYASMRGAAAVYMQSGSSAHAGHAQGHAYTAQPAGLTAVPAHKTAVPAYYYGQAVPTSQAHGGAARQCHTSAGPMPAFAPHPQDPSAPTYLF